MDHSNQEKPTSEEHAKMKIYFHEQLTKSNLLKNIGNKSQLFTYDDYLLYVKQTKVAQEKPKNIKKTSMDRARLKQYMVINEDGLDILAKRNKTKASDDLSPHVILHVVHEGNVFHVIHNTHLKNNHAGRIKMKKELNKRFSNISETVIGFYLESCVRCCPRQQKKKKRRNTKQVSGNYNRVFLNRGQIEIINCESFADGEFRYILLYVDMLNDFVQLRPLSEIDETHILKGLASALSTYGPPAILHCDNAGLCSEYHIIENMKIYWPTINMVYGTLSNNKNKEDMTLLTSVVLGVLKDKLRSLESIHWAQILPIVQYDLNSIPDDETGKCAIEKVTGQSAMKGLTSLHLPETTLITIRTEDELEAILKDLNVEHGNTFDLPINKLLETGTSVDSSSEKGSTTGEKTDETSRISHNTAMQEETVPESLCTNVSQLNSVMGKKGIVTVVEEETDNDSSVHSEHNSDCEEDYYEKASSDSLSENDKRDNFEQRRHLDPYKFDWENSSDWNDVTMEVSKKNADNDMYATDLNCCVSCGNDTVFRCEGTCGKNLHRLEECAFLVKRNNLTLYMCRDCEQKNKRNESTKFTIRKCKPVQLWSPSANIVFECPIVNGQAKQPAGFQFRENNLEGPCDACGDVTTRKCAGTCGRFLHHLEGCGHQNRNPTDSEGSFCRQNICDACYKHNVRDELQETEGNKGIKDLANSNVGEHGSCYACGDVATTKCAGTCGRFLHNFDGCGHQSRTYYDSNESDGIENICEDCYQLCVNKDLQATEVNQGMQNSAISNMILEGSCNACGNVTTTKCAGTCERFLHHSDSCGHPIVYYDDSDESYVRQNICSDCYERNIDNEQEYQATEGNKVVSNFSICDISVEGSCNACGNVTTRKCAGSCGRFLHHLDGCGHPYPGRDDSDESYSRQNICNDCYNQTSKHTPLERAENHSISSIQDSNTSIDDIIVIEDDIDDSIPNKRSKKSIQQNKKFHNLKISQTNPKKQTTIDKKLKCSQRTSLHAHCLCKSGCRSRRCPCRRQHTLCGVLCHPNGPCVNIS